MAPSRLLSRREVEGRIADGDVVIIHEGYALKLNRWIGKHPGGRLAIEHMVGRDASDEINVYHGEKTLRQMKGYRIGAVALPWINFEPPVRGGTFRPYEGEVEIVLQDPESSESDDKTDSIWSADSASVSGRLGVPARGASLTSASSMAEDDDADDGDAKSAGHGPKTATQCTRRIPFEAGGDDEKSEAPGIKNVSPEVYTSTMEQKEVFNDLRDYPSLDINTQQAIAREYHALHEEVKRRGHYRCRYSQYGKEAVRYSILFAAFIYLLSIKWYLTSACFLGMFWHQIMFTAHDAGHRGITGNFVKDTLIGAFIADFCCGLSIGWWKSSHNVHHLITNMPEHDPDIQNVPLFATSPTFFRSIKSTFYDFTFLWDAAADVLVPYQKYTYYPVMGIARFNLYLLSWIHLCSRRSAPLGAAWWTRPLEISFMLCYWAIFGYGLLICTLPTWPIRVAFVLISHCFTMVLHVQITLSHWGTSTADLGPAESFPQRQLRTTMDVDCPEWLDWFHGGLQFQAVHHLFPRVPRHNLRAVQHMVREFAHKTGIEYQCYGFVKGNEIVLSRLEEVGKMVETLVSCQKYMHETGESGLH